MTDFHWDTHIYKPLAWHETSRLESNSYVSKIIYLNCATVCKLYLIWSNQNWRDFNLTLVVQFTWAPKVVIKDYLIETMDYSVLRSLGTFCFGLTGRLQVSLIHFQPSVIMIELKVYWSNLIDRDSLMQCL